jgi:hypothetical protein
MRTCGPTESGLEVPPHCAGPNLGRGGQVFGRVGTLSTRGTCRRSHSNRADRYIGRTASECLDKCCAVSANRVPF